MSNCLYSYGTLWFSAPTECLLCTSLGLPLCVFCIFLEKYRSYKNWHWQSCCLCFVMINSTNTRKSSRNNTSAFLIISLHEDSLHATAATDVRLSPFFMRVSLPMEVCEVKYLTMLLQDLGYPQYEPTLHCSALKDTSSQKSNYILEVLEWTCKDHQPTKKER
jgi:hypothetical protein